MPLHLESWVWVVVFLIALAVFVHAVFELVRRLLARAALRLCEMRQAREGGFVCEMRRRLHRFSDRSLVPRVLVLLGAFSMMVYVVLDHSAKL